MAALALNDILSTVRKMEAEISELRLKIEKQIQFEESWPAPPPPHTEAPIAPEAAPAPEKAIKKKISKKKSEASATESDSAPKEKKGPSIWNQWMSEIPKRYPEQFAEFVAQEQVRASAAGETKKPTGLGLKFASIYRETHEEEYERFLEALRVAEV